MQQINSILFIIRAVVHFNSLYNNLILYIIATIVYASEVTMITIGNRIILLALGFFLFYPSIAGTNNLSPLCPRFTPENTQIHFDLDKTIIQRPSAAWLMYKVFNLLHEKYSVFTVLNIMINILFETTFNQAGCLTGHPWSLLYYAMGDSRVRSSIPQILQLVAQSYELVPGANNVLSRLQKKGYPILYSTNKDRFSYDVVAQKLGAPFSIPDTVITYFPHKSHPFFAVCKQYLHNHVSDQDDFYELINHICNIQPTQRIIHSSYLKPDYRFTQLQRSIAGNKHIIFFDDTKKNVISAGHDDNIFGFNTQESAISIINALILLGIINPEKDQLDATLLEQIQRLEYQGLFGLIKKSWDSVKAYFITPLVTPAVHQFETLFCGSQI